MDKRKVLLSALSVTLAGGMIVSAFMIWQQLHGQKKDQDSFEDLRQIAVSIEETPTPDETPAPSQEKLPVHKRDIASLMEKNGDTAGWIYIEGTKVDYPVMHTPNDPQKYIHMSFDGDDSYSGVPFMDARSSRAAANIIIYGHNMKSGTMFADIVNYLEKDFLNRHPIIEWETIAGCKEYRVFAVARIDMADKWYSFTAETQKANYDAMIDYILSNSVYDTGIRPEFGRQLITLSTCYGSSRDDRLIIVAAEAAE